MKLKINVGDSIFVVPPFSGEKPFFDLVTKVGKKYFIVFCNMGTTMFGSVDHPNDYISLLSMLTLACGLTFQLPMVAFVLSQVGILTPSFMREYRKHAMIVILIVAAIITPSPDVISQLLVAFPLLGLYEISIWVSGRVLRRKMREEALEN